jgi:8-oxo-dGTP pyrophosphatase MutT (NUDIX family)
VIAQYGVIAYDMAEDGSPRILLITSRETRRWVVPRGNPIAGLSRWHSAAQEAFEEAGVTGPVGTREIGSYRYEKRRRNGALESSTVALFPLLVAQEHGDWPERRERTRRWCTPAEAAQLVEEPALARLISGFDPAALDVSRETVAIDVDRASGRLSLLRLFRKVMRRLSPRR